MAYEEYFPECCYGSEVFMKRLFIYVILLFFTVGPGFADVRKPTPPTPPKPPTEPTRPIVPGSTDWKKISIGTIFE